jgi:hypothetical protein
MNSALDFEKNGSTVQEPVAVHVYDSHAVGELSSNHDTRSVLAHSSVLHPLVDSHFSPSFTSVSMMYSF